jgi:hypothetical protein
MEGGWEYERQYAEEDDQDEDLYLANPGSFSTFPSIAEDAAFSSPSDTGSSDSSDSLFSTGYVYDSSAQVNHRQIVICDLTWTPLRCMYTCPRPSVLLTMPPPVRFCLPRLLSSQGGAGGTWMPPSLVGADSSGAGGALGPSSAPPHGGYYGGASAGFLLPAVTADTAP